MVVDLQPEFIDGFATVAVVGSGEVEKFYAFGTVVDGGGGGRSVGRVGGCRGPRGVYGP